MSEFEPELGQAIFGQPHKQFEVPEIMDAALQFIGYELERIRHNSRLHDLPSPFGNSGNSGDFKSDVFEVCAYSWDETIDQPYNFKWTNLEISWYKYSGRGMSSNVEITPQMASDCLESCLRHLRQIDKENCGE